jgi:hypothetical protein
VVSTALGRQECQPIRTSGGIVVPSGHAPDEVRESVERIAGSALHDLDVAGGRIEVRIVDHIERVGTGLKQKPVVSEARA